ncbi:MAG: HAD-IA family hydrolase [Synechococcales cyanobacterium CRU_2_2]|nr:HAD-IA family hydrolase [Synechococcales cyanobacterium CRU_2_2]
MPTAITQIIFDLDGLLLNTEDLHASVIQEIAARYGKSYGPEVKAQVVGKRALESSQALVDALDLPLTGEACRAERHRMMRDRYSQTQLMPGVERLTGYFQAQGIPMAIATSSHTENFQLKTRHHQSWLQRFRTIVKGDDAALVRGKPAPDIFLLAAQRLGVEPQHCLVFEDSPAGVSAARSAGMSVVAIPDPDLDLSLFQKAHQVLPSLEEFMPEYWNFEAMIPCL